MHIVPALLPALAGLPVAFGNLLKLDLHLEKFTTGATEDAYRRGRLGIVGGQIGFSTAPRTIHKSFSFPYHLNCHNPDSAITLLPLPKHDNIQGYDILPLHST